MGRPRQDAAASPGVGAGTPARTRALRSVHPFAADAARRPAHVIGEVRSAMAVVEPCENCGRETPVYRLAAVILDGRVARICPVCASTERERIEIPYQPRADQGAIQPSTSRDVW